VPLVESVLHHRFAAAGLQVLLPSSTCRIKRIIYVNFTGKSLKQHFRCPQGLYLFRRQHDELVLLIQDILACLVLKVPFLVKLVDLSKWFLLSGLTVPAQELSFDNLGSRVDGVLKGQFGWLSATHYDRRYGLFIDCVRHRWCNGHLNGS